MTDTSQAHSASDGLAIFGEFAADGQGSYDNAVQRFKERNIVSVSYTHLTLPTIYSV